MKMFYDILASSYDISLYDISYDDAQERSFTMPTTNTSALTETAYYILLSLQTPLHGYAIMQNIKSITNGRISMGAGTLYGALNALNEKKYIVECECDDPSRREYVITNDGKEVLKKEISRLEEMLQNAQTYFKED